MTVAPLLFSWARFTFERFPLACEVFGNAAREKALKVIVTNP